MGSVADRPQLGSRMMPYLTILRHDLRTLWASRLVRLWLGAGAALALVLIAGNWSQFQDAPLIASVLFPYLVFPWFFVVVVLGVSPVSGSRAEALADGILSRPVSRTEYMLAVWSARVALVWSVFLLVTVPAIMILALAKRPVPADTVTAFGIVSALFVAGLVQTFLVSLAFLAGTLLRKPLLAVVVLVFFWYPVGLILSTFSLEEFSPISLSRATTTQLRQTWRRAEPQTDVNADAQAPKTFTRQVDHFFEVLSGGQPEQEVTKPEFFEGQDFEDFSLLRVTIGYGLPTILSVVLATICFYRRDL